jgi:hypothetical protein
MSRPREDVWEKEFNDFCKGYKKHNVQRPSFRKLIEMLADEANPACCYRVHLFFDNDPSDNAVDTFTTSKVDEVIGFLFDKVELYGWTVDDVNLCRYVKNSGEDVVIWLKGEI